MKVLRRLPKRRREAVRRITKRRRTTTPQSSADWSSIPGDILILIAEKIDSVEDFVHCSAVCHDWYVFAADFNNKPNFPAPYCMLRSVSDSDSNSKVRFRTNDPNVAKKELVLHLPEVSGRKCWGSPFGWMVTFGPNDSQFSLLNPFTRSTLPLPSIRTLIGNSGIEYNPYKAFLTANPNSSPDNCIVLVVVHVGEEDSILAFARPGGNVWSRVQGPSDLNDIICFEGNLYGVRRNRDHSPVLVLIQIDQPCPRAVELPMAGDSEESDFTGFKISPNLASSLVTRRYLVDLNGELCLAIRYVSGPRKTLFVKILKINLSTRKWTEVHSLGYQCLFVGNNYTFTCKATSPFLEPYMPKYPPRDFTSDHVFYTHDDDYTFYPKIEIPPDIDDDDDILSDNEEDETPKCTDVGVFAISPCESTCMVPNAGITYPQLWIMPSLW